MLPQNNFHTDKQLRCDILPALHAFIGLGENGDVSFYPKNMPFTVLSFYSKNVQNTISSSLHLWLDTCFIVVLGNSSVLWECVSSHRLLWESNEVLIGKLLLYCPTCKRWCNVFKVLEVLLSSEFFVEYLHRLLFIQDSCLQRVMSLLSSLVLTWLLYFFCVLISSVYLIHVSYSFSLFLFFLFCV